MSESMNLKLCTHSSYGGSDGADYHIIDEDGTEDGRLVVWGQITKDEGERIVRCVNALNGLSNLHLDGGWNYKVMNASAFQSEQRIKELEQENAELKRINERFVAEVEQLASAHNELKRIIAESQKQVPVAFAKIDQVDGEVLGVLGYESTPFYVHKLFASPVIQEGMLEQIAKAIHYPECWDTACYKTPLEAIQEWFVCSECVGDTWRKQKNCIEVVSLNASKEG